jgi:hypothetical protein
VFVPIDIQYSTSPLLLVFRSHYVWTHVLQGSDTAVSLL